MIAHEFINLSLEKKIKLEALNLEYITPLNKAQWKDFGDALAQCTSLTSFSIVPVRNFYHEDFLSLGKSFAGNQTLKRLDLSAFKLGSDDTLLRGSSIIQKMEAVQYLLKQCPDLVFLNLDSNSLNELFSKNKYEAYIQQLIASFKQMFSSCPNLKGLSLRNNNLGKLSETEHHWYALAEVLGQLPALTSLNLGDNSLNLDPHVLRRVLAHCPQLTSIDLTNTRLQSLPAFSEMQTPINVLVLNRIDTQYKNSWVNFKQQKAYDDEKWMAICQDIAKCPELTHLHLDDNDWFTSTSYLDSLSSFHEKNWQALCIAIAQCPALTSLSLGGNDLHKISEAGWQALGQALAKCPMFTSLNLSNNQLDKLNCYQWRGIGQLLSQCSALKNLVLSNNQLDKLYFGYSLSLFWPSPWSAFTQAIAQSNTIESVGCDDFGGERGNTIKAILARNAQQRRNIETMPLVQNPQPLLQEMATNEFEISFSLPIAVALPIETYDNKEPSAPPAYLVNR